MNGLQTMIVLQTQLLHILFTSTVRAAIQMRERRRHTERLRVGETQETVEYGNVFSPSRRVYSSQHKSTLTLNGHIPSIIEQLVRPVVALESTNVYHSFSRASSYSSGQRSRTQSHSNHLQMTLASRKADLRLNQHTTQTLHSEYRITHHIVVALVTVPPSLRTQ